MENNENTSNEKSGFMQGWGFILLIIGGVIGALVALKSFID